MGYFAMLINKYMPRSREFSVSLSKPTDRWPLSY